MSKSWFVRERLKRKVELLKYIAENSNSPLPVDTLVGAFSWTWGLRSTKIHEYLDELATAGLITITRGNVKLTEKGKAILEEGEVAKRA
jgi:predicted transcriptional regulator